MRRGQALHLARALLARCGTAPSALPATASGALAALQGALPSQPPLPLWRPFTSSNVTALFNAQQQPDEPSYEQQQPDVATHEQHEQQRRQRYPQRQHRNEPAADSPLGRLAACRTAEERGFTDIRAWQASLGEDFQAPELAAAVRALFVSERRSGRGSGMKPGSPDYMRELLSLAADGRVALDGKAAAYLVWGAAKTQLRSSEPELQRVVPLVFEHIDTMRANDMSSLIWGMGLLGIKPSSEQRGQLRNGLLPLLAQDSEGAMRMKDLTATAVGVSRLGLPTDIVASLVEAFEHRITSGAPVSLGEATRLVKVLPYLPGLTPSSPLPLAVFDCLLTNAHSPGAKLHSLADMAFAAGKMGCCFNGADVERLLSCAADKLGQNRGPQVHALLHGLGLMGLRASEQGPVTNEFVSECVDSQLTTQQQPQHMARLVSAVGALRAALPEDRLQRMLEELSANGLASLPEWQVRMALIGFRRLRFQPGVEALEPFAHFKKPQEEGQQQQEEAQEQHQQQEEEEATQQQQ